MSVPDLSPVDDTPKRALTIEEAYATIAQQQPRLLYVAGKTSTGKSTFAQRLRDALGYAIIELDDVVKQDIIPAFDLTDEGTAFVELYKERHNPELTAAFEAAAKARIDGQLATTPVVVEGALAHPDGLKALFRHHPDFTFLYFHPKQLHVYERNLTSRFMTVHQGYLAGLPIGFWEIMGKDTFEEFCRTHELSSAAKHAIHKYACASQAVSSKRLHRFATSFPEIIEVDI
jgi:gluconate kinase